MFFLNFSAAEFFSLLGVLGGLITALYLLDRARRRKVVSTLRFWTPAGAADQRQTRKRMNDPWSLILQLVSLALLLLAAAQVQFGGRQNRGRDHVVLLDDSAWSNAQAADGTGTVLESERSAVKKFLVRLPARDRVMLMTADSNATPLTSFTANRTQTLDALARATGAVTALDTERVLAFAAEAQSWSGGTTGEIVYCGPQLVKELSRAAVPSNLRVIPIPANRANAGIRQLSVRRAEESRSDWQASVRVKNYGALKRQVRLALRVGATNFAPRLLTLAPGEEQSAEYNFVTNGHGDLTATTQPPDSLARDDRATLRLPVGAPLRILVVTDRAALLKPLLVSNHQLEASFISSAQYAPEARADVVVFDRIVPAQPPSRPALWIDPPADRSPLPVSQALTNTAVKSWHGESALGAALLNRELRLPAAQVFETFEGDQVVAAVEQGPVVVVRPSSKNHSRAALVGFDPADDRVRYQVAVPLLFANLFAWLNPDTFETSEAVAQQAGLNDVPLDLTDTPDQIHVTSDIRAAVPYSIRQHTLQLFAAQPEIVAIASPGHQQNFSLTLPDVADQLWQIPAGARQGLPAAAALPASAVDLWKWLALLGAAGLLMEWLRFGGDARLPRRTVSAPLPSAPEARPEMVSR